MQREAERKAARLLANRVRTIAVLRNENMQAIVPLDLLAKLNPA
jgi:hypothetical protein